MQNRTDSPAATVVTVPHVAEPCVPYFGRAPVNLYAIAYRLDEATLRDMAVMLTIVHPGHFETILRDRGQR